MEFIHASKIIQSVNNWDNWFGVQYNMNIYRGCNHGCIYCDSRSSCYQVHDFDNVKAKYNAPTMIEKELSGKRKKGIIGMGAMSDPYNPFEKQLEYTRKSLVLINKFQFGVFAITKSASILRDIDLYKSIMQHSAVNVGITITTSDESLQKKLEPNASTTNERFLALAKLSEEGIFCGVLMMPILPFINDTIENIEQIVKRTAAANGKYIIPSFGVTLRDNQRVHYYQRIGKELVEKYQKTFCDSYMCTSLHVAKLKEHFEKLCDEYKILYRMKDVIEASKNAVIQKQTSLFF